MLEVGFNTSSAPAATTTAAIRCTCQAHSAPGVYARAFLEGRLSEAQLGNFRRELAAGGGLPSYPHPRRCRTSGRCPPPAWGCRRRAPSTRPASPSTSRAAGLKPKNGGKIWTFIGDGEADEPEVLGTINIASRERLDNLVLVVNCNLQRLDGPVRGNGKIIQELERSFRGADWHVIKVIWGSGWDPILDRDVHGLLQRRMEQAVDGDYQMYTVSSGDVVREHWVENTPELRRLMQSLTDEEIRSIKRGGQDHKKIYAAFHHAARGEGKPCVILLKTVKGDGLGARHRGQQHRAPEEAPEPEERRDLAKRLGIPLPAEAVARAEFYRPPKTARRSLPATSGAAPRRLPAAPRGALPAARAAAAELFRTCSGGSKREISTTMAVVRMLSRLLRHRIGRYVVPIVPDEARTFGMDGLFPQAGIYSPAGQRYRPVDAGTIAPYREAEDGQILQEGICETGAMASFMAAGTAYANTACR
jgi:pyruvate dehydrogenase E1 component